jgi:hypothetical protein
LLNSSRFPVISAYANLFAYLCFLFVSSQNFRDFVLNVLANVVGLIITILIRFILLLFLRKKYFTAFYRRSPAVTNIAGLALECWQIALTVGYTSARSIRLLIASLFYMGRIDVPMLNTDTKVGPLHVDYYPMVFRKDLLQHEAHR